MKLYNKKAPRIRKALRIRKGFTLVETLVVIAIIATLAGISYGPIMKQIGSAERAEAISNARSINTALLFFYANNNRNFPNAITDRSMNGVATSNALFQQLIDSNIMDDEKFFWNKRNARAGFGSLNEPNSDGVLNQDENVWNYVLNVDADSTIQPLFYDSNIGGSTFTAKTWGGRAIIARVEGSVVFETIQFSGLPEPSPNVFATGPVYNNNNMDILGKTSLPPAAIIVPR